MKFPKVNVKKSAGLVAGATGASYVSNKLLAGQNDYVRAGVPMLAGLVLGAQADALAKGAGDGMFAVAGASLITKFIPGIGQDVLMGEDVMLTGTDFEDYSSSSFDTTAAAGGEMNY